MIVENIWLKIGYAIVTIVYLSNPQYVSAVISGGPIVPTVNYKSTYYPPYDCYSGGNSPYPTASTLPYPYHPQPPPFSNNNNYYGYGGNGNNGYTNNIGRPYDQTYPNGKLGSNSLVGPNNPINTNAPNSQVGRYNQLPYKSLFNNGFGNTYVPNSNLPQQPFSMPTTQNFDPNYYGRSVLPPSYSYFDKNGEYGISNYEGYLGNNNYLQPSVAFTPIGTNTPSPVNCRDRSTDCALLASTGQCINSASTQSLCPISCGVGCLNTPLSLALNENPYSPLFTGFQGLSSAFDDLNRLPLSSYIAPESYLLRYGFNGKNSFDSYGSNLSPYINNEYNQESQSQLPISCRDSHIQGCPNWALLGYCNSNSEFMLVYCRASCRVCENNLNSLSSGNRIMLNELNNLNANNRNGLNNNNLMNEMNLFSSMGLNGLNEFKSINNVNDLNAFGLNNFQNLNNIALNDPIGKDFRMFNNLNSNMSAMNLQKLLSSSNPLSNNLNNKYSDLINEQNIFSPNNPFVDSTSPLFANPTLTSTELKNMINTLNVAGRSPGRMNGNAPFSATSSLPSSLKSFVSEKRIPKSEIAIMRDKASDSLTKNTILRMDELRV